MNRPNLVDVLGLTGHQCVTITGGGGKTTLLFLLGEALGEKGASPLLTTTTKMAYPVDFNGRITLSEDWETLATAVAETQNSPLYLAGGRVNPQKVYGLPPVVVDALYTNFPHRPVVVEGDGSAQKSYKFYKRHEPVIPSCTTTLIHLIGCDLLDEPMDGAQLHRCPQEFVGQPFDTAFFAQAMDWYTSEILGEFKGRKLLVINKADGDNTEKGWRMQAAAADYFDRCFVASLKKKEIS